MLQSGVSSPAAAPTAPAAPSAVPLPVRRTQSGRSSTLVNSLRTHSAVERKQPDAAPPDFGRRVTSDSKSLQQRSLAAARGCAHCTKSQCAKPRAPRRPSGKAGRRSLARSSASHERSSIRSR
eukprot:267247-Prymnesium_polylepis.1